jgi:tetrahydromethanopterin S-methyltransferase subunit D
MLRAAVAGAGCWLCACAGTQPASNTTDVVLLLALLSFAAGIAAMSWSKASTGAGPAAGAAATGVLTGLVSTVLTGVLTGGVTAAVLVTPARLLLCRVPRLVRALVRLT